MTSQAPGGLPRSPGAEIIGLVLAAPFGDDAGHGAPPVGVHRLEDLPPVDDVERMHQSGEFTGLQQVCVRLRPPAEGALGLEESLHHEDAADRHPGEQRVHPVAVKIVERQDHLKSAEVGPLARQVRRVEGEFDAARRGGVPRHLEPGGVAVHGGDAGAEFGGGDRVAAFPAGQIENPHPGTDEVTVPREPGAGSGQGGEGRGGQPGVGHRTSPVALAARPWEVLVIGGGIVGAAIARDAAMRGYRVALVEQADFGAGTSSHSSRLAHGGLRYLEHGDFKLVFEALRERGTLLRIAPHLVRPLPFIFPVHRGDRVGFWKLAAGMWLYDVLALFRNVPRHRMLGKRALLQAEPMLRERGLVGGARYFDAQMDDARLTLATVRDAERRGAAVASYVTVTGLDVAGGRVGGVRVRDLLSGEEALVRSTIVVNATGPWTDRLRRMEDPSARPLLRLTKGVHVMVRRDRIGHHDAVTLTSAVDGRVMFVLPWGDLSYIGTTDTDTDEAPETVRATDEDIRYLLRSANAMFPNAHLVAEDVLATWAGLRPLLADPGAHDTASVSREHTILVGSGGMISIAGGKLTTHREMAAQLVDRVGEEFRRLEGRARPRRAPTDREHLPGGEAADLEPFRREALEAGLDAAAAEHLLRHYGSETAAVLNLVRSDRRLGGRLTSGHPAIQATVIQAARREYATSVEDVLVRRLHLYYETADQGRAAAARVADLMGPELGWPDPAARAAEYVRRVDAGGFSEE